MPVAIITIFVLCLFGGLWVRPAAGPPPPVSGLTRLLIRTQEVQYGQYPAIAVGGGQVQLGEDRVDVLGHGAVADHERRRDVAVRPALGHERQHLPLPPGEPVGRVGLAAQQQLCDHLPAPAELRFQHE